MVWISGEWLLILLGVNRKRSEFEGMYLKKNLNASRHSEHPTQGGNCCRISPSSGSAYWFLTTRKNNFTLCPRVKTKNNATLRILVRICEDTKSKGSEVVLHLFIHTVVVASLFSKYRKYYLEKIPKNDTGVLRTESKETPDLDQQRTQQRLTQSNPRHPILNME